MGLFADAVKEVLGESYGSEIFLHESCIYMDVTLELLERGFKVWQVYDCWFAHKDGVSNDEFEVLVKAIIRDKANFYIKKFFERR